MKRGRHRADRMGLMMREDRVKDIIWGRSVHLMRGMWFSMMHGVPYIAGDTYLLVGVGRVCGGSALRLHILAITTAPNHCAARSMRSKCKRNVVFEHP